MATFFSHNHHTNLNLEDEAFHATTPSNLLNRPLFPRLEKVGISGGEGGEGRSEDQGWGEGDGPVRSIAINTADSFPQLGEREKGQLKQRRETKRVGTQYGGKTAQFSFFPLPPVPPKVRWFFASTIARYTDGNFHKLKRGEMRSALEHVHSCSFSDLLSRCGCALPLGPRVYVNNMYHSSL